MEFNNLANGAFEIKGAQFGVVVTPREGHGPLVQLLSEDDGNWSEKGSTFDSFWLRELIGILGMAEKTDTVQKANKETLRKIRGIALRSKKRGV